MSQALPRKFVPLLLMMAIWLGLSSCEKAEDIQTKGLLRPGVVALLRAFDRNYEYELQKIKGGLSVWDVIWDGESVAQRSYYRGLFTMAGTSSNNQFINVLETDKIDGLFPLRVGREASFFGTRTNLGSNDEMPFWTRYRVVEETTVELLNGRYEVFVIEMIMEINTEEGVDRVVRRLWYSPVLEFTLKGEQQWNEQSMQWYVTGFTTSSKSTRHRQRVGTVLI